MAKPGTYEAILLYIMTFTLILSSLLMISTHWPREEGRNYFLVSSTAGIVVLLILSIFLMIKSTSFGVIIMVIQIWLLITFIWSGFIGAGLWLRYYNIFNDGSTISKPLSLDESAFYELNWADNNLPFDNGNPLYFTFANWSQATLRLDYMSTTTRDCSYSNSGYICRYCVAPLVYRSWNPGDPVSVWAGCSGNCQVSMDEYGNSLTISSCENLVNQGYGCFKFWRKLFEDNPNGTDPYPDTSNYGYRHFQYIHKYREAVTNSPLGFIYPENVVLLRLSTYDNKETDKEKFHTNGLAMVLTPLLFGMVPMSIIFFYYVFKSLRIHHIQDNFRNRTQDRSYRNNTEYRNNAEDRRVSSDSELSVAAPVPVNFEQVDALPSYNELDIPPPTYSET